MTKTVAKPPFESLEDRQFFSVSLGTMNVIDAGTHPALVTSYTLNGVKDYAEAGVYNWTRAAINPGEQLTKTSFNVAIQLQYRTLFLFLVKQTNQSVARR